jgi:hypothetical protein
MKRFRQQLIAHEQETLLNDHFPLKYTIAHSLSLVLMGTTAMVLQVIIMTMQDSEYYLANGLWAGFACTIPGFFGFLFGITYSVNFYEISRIIKFSFT